MLKKKLSVHLQDFPDVSFIDENRQLVADMDIIRDICAAILFIRDQKNLRVRLPLNKVTIFNYGDKQTSLLNIKNNQSYQDLIKDEVNVKNIEVVAIAEQNKDIAQLKLQLNFKKIGAKFGPKMKEISKNAKEGNWQKLSENKIKIADVILEEGDFEIKLIAKDQESSATLPSNDCIVQLDINITKELEQEGLARDIVRAIQQNRKEADLDVSDNIKISCYSENQDILEVIGLYKNNIKEQVLGKEITIASNKESCQINQHIFDNLVENCDLTVSFQVVEENK